MTSTTVFKGSLGEKPSSRVLQPPGGGSSNIFSSQQLDSTNRPLKDASIGESLQPLSNNEPTNLSSETKVAMKSVASSQQPTVQPVICRNRNSGFNPITGEFSGESVATTKTQSSTCITVRQPPGGASSGLW